LRGIGSTMRVRRVAYAARSRIELVPVLARDRRPFESEGPPSNRPPRQGPREPSRQARLPFGTGGRGGVRAARAGERWPIEREDNATMTAWEFGSRMRTGRCLSQPRTRVACRASTLRGVVA
jgi:hypothetical protein